VIEVSESAVVDAPLAAVWAFMDDPHNQPEISPSITDVRDVEQDATGKSLSYTYRMAGVPIDGSMSTSTYDPEERVVFDLEGPLSGTITWTFEALDDGRTRVTYGAAYDLPSKVLESVVRRFAERYNERELRTTLENLQTQFASD
jgi:carbon monoxide dehydrogenase subunit G